MKRKGYVLFEYYERTITSHDYCSSMEELLHQYDIAIDDKWDMNKRNKIHFFYLDIESGKYVPLMRWKKEYDPFKLNETDKKVLSTKTF